MGLSILRVVPVGLLFFACLVSPAGAVTIELVPSAIMVEPGDSLDVEVHLNGLGTGASPSLRGFDLELTYDPVLFSLPGFSGLTPGPALGDPLASPPQTYGAVFIGTDRFRYRSVSLLDTPTLLANQSDSVLLFTLNFQAMGSGNGNFGLNANSLPGDELGNPLALDPVDAVNVTVGAPRIIPTLGTWGVTLLMLLLAAAAMLQRRRLRS